MARARAFTNGEIAIRPERGFLARTTLVVVPVAIRTDDGARLEFGVKVGACGGELKGLVVFEGAPCA